MKAEDVLFFDKSKHGPISIKSLPMPLKVGVVRHELLLASRVPGIVFEPLALEVIEPPLLATMGEGDAIEFLPDNDQTVINCQIFCKVREV
jgi:hypothetical protein